MVKTFQGDEKVISNLKLMRNYAFGECQTGEDGGDGISVCYRVCAWFAAQNEHIFHPTDVM